MAKIFFDTNVLIYSLDKADARKQKISRKFMAQAAGNNNGVISTQVLQEFYVVATTKLSVDALIAKSLVHSLGNYETVTINAGLVAEAIDCSILNRLSLWDALIVVAAESAKCHELWTEDLNHGQIIRGVKVVNPFL